MKLKDKDDSDRYMFHSAKHFTELQNAKHIIGFNIDSNDVQDSV